MESAALRGVRLSGTVTLHLEGCRACARAHRSIRRRRRVALLIPFGLLVKTAGLRDKLRDVIAFNPAWEAHAAAAKMCTAACLTAVGTTTVAGPAATVAVPLVVRTATPEPRTAELVPARDKPRKRKPKPKTSPAPTATAPAATPTWTPTVAPTRTPVPESTAPAPERRKRVTPTVYPAGMAGSAPSVSTPTPEPTPLATPTAAPPTPTPPSPETAMPAPTR
jgi:hypothetical protein